MTDALTGLSDTRISSFGTNATGVPFGLASAAPTSTTYAKILGTSFKQVNSSFVFINAASVLLAKAEAIELGWTSLTTADAETAYKAAITASFAQWGVTLPASYLTTGVANYQSGIGVAAIGGSSVAGSNATTATKIARINLQQWIAFYPNGRQGWSNWRRTGFPDLKPTVNASNTGGKIPRRIPYGPNDYASNAVQVALAATAIGGDTQDTRVWWDK